MLRLTSLIRGTAILGIGAASAAAQQYTVVDLAADLPQSPTGQPLYPTTAAAGLNELGDVLIDAHQTGGTRLGAVWDAGVLDVLSLTGVIPTGLDAEGNVGGIRLGQSFGWYEDANGPVCVPEPIWCNSTDYFYASSRVLGMEEGGRFTGGLSLPGIPGSGVPFSFLATMLIS